jgi:probable 2-oxoglutarate dehydrogenase E1 component DHKTD1
MLSFLLQSSGERVCPLAEVVGSTGRLEVVNSNLSELAVLGFEFGYSWEDPRALVG